MTGVLIRKPRGRHRDTQGGAGRGVKEAERGVLLPQAKEHRELLATTRS